MKGLTTNKCFAFVGNTRLLEDNKRNIGLVGMLIGAGEITGKLE